MSDPLDDTLALLGAFTRTMERIKAAHAREVADLMQEALALRVHRSKAEEALIALEDELHKLQSAANVVSAEMMSTHQANALIRKHANQKRGPIPKWAIAAVLEAANGGE